MSFRMSLIAAAVLALTGLSCMPAFAGTGSAFRFLTQELPRGSSNIEYAATIVTANASGPVTFSVTPNPPAPGLTFNNATGFLSGIPTEVNASGFDVTITANDGTTTLTLNIKLSISASGGGGNSGVSFATKSLPDARVASAYTATLQAQNAIGPVLFGATDLPPGLSLSGLTGEITGTPSGPGTYYVTFSATDRGENDNKVFTVLPLLVLPEASDFQFTNVILNNGEVGTPYTETLTTSGGSGTLSFSASGIPPGTSIDAATGVISGTPTTPGTYLVFLAANDGIDTLVLNRTILIAPSSTSSFLWDFFGLPAAIVNIEFGRQPPILIAASNGSNSVTYSATGLPSGITYSTTTGELAGMAIEVGINPVVFTATDSGTGEVLELAIDFVVLPPNGGDTNSLPINLWVKKMTLKSSQEQKASWKAFFIYNADRRPANAFDPATHTFSVSLGSRTLTIDPGGMTNSNGRFTFKSAKGASPVESVTIDPRKQVIVLSTKNDAIPDTVPGVLRHTMTLGNKGYKLDLFFDSKGKFTATSGYRKTAFVVDKAKVSAKGTMVLLMLLGDPSFTYTSGVSVMRFRMLDGATVLVDKTFTDLVSSKESTDRKTGGTIFKLKGSKDAAAANTLAKFAYISNKGKLILGMKNVDLSGLTASPTHVGIELTVGDKVYTTAVTLFAPSSGTYTTIQK